MGSLCSAKTDDSKHLKLPILFILFRVITLYHITYILPANGWVDENSTSILHVLHKLLVYYTDYKYCENSMICLLSIQITNEQSIAANRGNL